jgi:hypothetical protein
MAIFDEATDLYRLSGSPMLPTVLLSIGTGQMDLIKLEEAGMLNWWQDRSGLSCAKALSDIATDCHGTHLMVTRRFEEFERGHLYFRFNVTKGLEKVILHEYEKAGDIESATLDYLNDINAKREPEKCSKILVGDARLGATRPTDPLTRTTPSPPSSSLPSIQRRALPWTSTPTNNIRNYAGHNINQVDQITGTANFD